MTQQRSAESARSPWPTPARRPTTDLHANEITDIMPYDEFGSLVELDFRDNAFDADTDVLNAPELDDLLHAENVVPLLLARRKDLDDDDEVRSGIVTDAGDGVDTAVTDVLPRVGQHRKANPSPLKGRVMIAAMAAGAAAAAAHTAINSAQAPSTKTVLAADRTSMGDPALVRGSSGGMQLVAVTPIANSTHSEELATGVAFAQERAEREARLQRPLFVSPTRGIFTSGFGYRWGALHAGVDVANSIGTPIYAVADGVVIDAGPTAGYGAVVKLRHADGTVTLYGHVNSWLVNVGQRVMAGDEIATIGNRGNSTGPHLHFEVMPNGQDRIDPVPWLAARGIGLGG